MRVGVLGTGAVGTRAARQLAATPTVDEVVVADTESARAERVASALAPKVRAVGIDAFPTVDVVVLATPTPQAETAAAMVRLGSSVVATTDDLADVDQLLGLDALARSRGVAVVPGAVFAPGLTCLLARFAAQALDRVDEIHVAKHGTGGPACARQHHRALGGLAVAWQDGVWTERQGGSGRELCWFPDPVAAHDCYQAEVADPILLVAAFPDVARVSTRMSATRRDRLTARLPMLRKPHPEGVLGAVRVEVRGKRQSERAIEVLGAIDRPAAAAGAVAAVAATMVVGRGTRRGAFGLGDAAVDAEAVLVELARRGVKAARYMGAAA
jgi:saccharopine dehydrogenase-like NADP-dependent oxidoreductase